MFKELGYKLKFMAYVVYWLCLALLAILGLFMILKGNLFGYVVAFTSIIIAWIPAAIIYAIGEMYEKVMYEGKEVPIFKTKAQHLPHGDRQEFAAHDAQRHQKGAQGQAVQRHPSLIFGHKKFSSHHYG